VISSDSPGAEAGHLMMQFAERTGLSSSQPGRRYLWTDAFAVCTFLGLARTTGEQRFTELALRTIDRVHHDLGMHRPDEGKTGWISGLDAAEGEAHPTRGGLRIGKRLPERRPEEPFDDRLEWERDGQYFHYLTKWMEALDQAARALRQPLFNLWARELADTAYRAFTSASRARGAPRLAWKMSIDLSRPLVSSTGLHDPLDGLVTILELEETAAVFSTAGAGPNLRGAAADLLAMMNGSDWATADPLGLGGILVGAFRVEQLMHHGAISGEDLLDSLLSASLDGLRVFVREGDLLRPASERLAFRELGLSIGLHALARLDDEVAKVTSRIPDGSRARHRLQTLRPFIALGADLEAFWLIPEHRRVAAWIEHRDINDVMLATSLAPEGYLVRLAMP
jgi:hypothetical protein